MLKYTDIRSWVSAPVGHVESFVRLYARGYVGVSHKARAVGGPSVTVGGQYGTVEHSLL